MELNRVGAPLAGLIRSTRRMPVVIPLIALLCAVLIGGFLLVTFPPVPPVPPLLPVPPYFLHWRWGPHPQRELTLMPRLGFACPRLGIAAGAPSSCP